MVTIDDLSQKLKKNSFLFDFSDRELKKVLANTTLRSFSSGEKLFEEGESGTSMFLVLSGKLKVQRKGHVIAIRDAGALVGEMSLLDPAPRSASVVGVGKGVCLEFQRARLFELLRQGDTSGIKIFQKMTELACVRLREVNQLIAEQVEGSHKQDGSLFRRFLGKL